MFSHSCPVFHGILFGFMMHIHYFQATTRVKLNFLDKLLKFWELQVLYNIETTNTNILSAVYLYKVPALILGYLDKNTHS